MVVSAHLTANCMARAMVKVDETRKLPVWPTVSDAWEYFWENLGHFLRLAALVVLAVVVIQLAVDYGLGPEPEGGRQSSTLTQMARDWLEDLAIIAAMTPFYVAWSRHLLVREIDPEAHARLELGKREIRYLMWSVIVLAISSLPLTSHTAASNWVDWQGYITGAASGDDAGGGLAVMLGMIAWFIAGALTFLYLSARLVLVLPAISVGQRLSLAGSWRLTRRSGWRIAAALVAAFIPLFVLAAVLTIWRGNPGIESMSTAAYITDIVLYMIVWSACIATAVTIGCMCFCVFTGWPRRDLLRG